MMHTYMHIIIMIEIKSTLYSSLISSIIIIFKWKNKQVKLTKNVCLYGTIIKNSCSVGGITALGKNTL